jgi:hypothetical protein
MQNISSSPLFSNSISQCRLLIFLVPFAGCEDNNGGEVFMAQEVVVVFTVVI